MFPQILYQEKQIYVLLFSLKQMMQGGVHLTKTMSISSTPIRHPISNFQKIELIINLTAKTKELKSHAEGGC